jgi:hypothetical protein
MIAFFCAVVRLPVLGIDPDATADRMDNLALNISE